MRSLGYPRIISVENFRNPNFELVADCLDWLVQRFDESADIDDDISTEQDRVTFLKNVSKVFMSRRGLSSTSRGSTPPTGTHTHPTPHTIVPFQITQRQSHRFADFPPLSPLVPQARRQGASQDRQLALPGDQERG